jgi:acetyltransferase
MLGRRFVVDCNDKSDFPVGSYPSQWCRHLVLESGWRILVRPIRPDDEPLLLRFLEHESKEDLRLRFFASIKEFTHQFLTSLVDLDYARAMAFVAFDEVNHELVGVVRIHLKSIEGSGEFAILLRSDHKSQGLGWSLMQLIIEFAKSRHLKCVLGQVLQENAAMLNMCRELGFKLKFDPGDPGVCDVILSL